MCEKRFSATMRMTETRIATVVAKNITEATEKACSFVWEDEASVVPPEWTFIKIEEASDA